MEFALFDTEGASDFKPIMRGLVLQRPIDKKLMYRFTNLLAKRKNVAVSGAPIASSIFLENQYNWS